MILCRYWKKTDFKKHLFLAKNYNLFLSSICLDEGKINVKLDRFDPGSFSKSGDFFPCAVFPNDIVVPVSFTKKLSKSGNANLHIHKPTKEQYYKAFLVYFV